MIKFYHYEKSSISLIKHKHTNFIVNIFSENVYDDAANRTGNSCLFMCVREKNDKIKSNKIIGILSSHIQNTHAHREE